MSPIPAPRRSHARAALILTALLTVPSTFAGTTWDGGASDDLWGSGDNWDPDGAPVPGAGVDLLFTGTTRLNPLNNYTDYDDFHHLDFDAGAGSFTIGGNAIDLFGRIENQSANLQTVSLELAINGGQSQTGEFNPVNGDLLINGPNVYTNGNTLQVWGDNGKTVTFDTLISQGGGLSVNQNSHVVLLGANTYTGTTTLNAGTLTLGNGGTSGQLGSGSVSLAAGTSLTSFRSDNLSIANAISGDGSFIQAGSGTTTFSNQKTYTGGTLVSAGILDLTGGGGATGTIRGTATVESGAILRLSTGDATGYNTGSASLTTIILNGGTLHLNTALNQTLGGATIQMTGGSITGIANSNLDFFNGGSALNVLSSASTATISGTKINLRQNNGVTFTVADGSQNVDLLVSSVISSSSGFTNNHLHKAGAGTMQLSAANTYSTLTDVQAGRLLVTGSLANTSGVQVASGAIFETNAINVFTGGHGTGMAAGRAVTIDGGTWLMSGGESRFGNVNLQNGGILTSNTNTAWGMLLGNLADNSAATISVTGTGAATMNGSGGIRMQGVQNFNVADTTGSSANDLIVSLQLRNPGSIGGAAGGIHKSGAGTMLLSNLGNDFAGAVTVSAGTLVTGTAQSAGTTGYLGAITGGRTVTVQSGGVLDFRANNVFGGSGKSAATIPDVVVDGATLTSTRFNILGNLTLNSGATLTQSSTDSGSYQGYQFLGTITVGGTSASTISSGNGKANHLRGGATTTFDVADATGSAAADLVVDNPLANGSGDYTGTGSLEKSGAGTMRLEGSHTYTGATTVSGGTLALGANASLATSGYHLAVNTTLDVSAVSGGWTLASGRSLTGHGIVDGAATIAGNLSPGSSAGDLTFTSSLGLTATSQTFIEIGGNLAGEFDRLLVNGNLDAGGVFLVSFIDSFSAQAGDSFQIADFGSFTDSGYTFDFTNANLDPGLEWDTSSFDTTGTLFVIPEPHSMLLGSLAGLLLLRRRRSA